jgi:hypothetical protein
MNAINLRLVATRAAEVAIENADTVIDTTNDAVVDNGNDSSFGDKVMDIVTNKFVVGGAAAIVVAGAAYGVFRWLKKDDKKAVTPAATKAPVAPAEPEMTTEQMILKARELLTSAESRLNASTKEGVPAAAAA